MTNPQFNHLWVLVHAERAALADDLAGLSAPEWEQATLCTDWTVEDVVAHLTAVACVTRGKWLRSMLAARLRPEVHNRRRLAEYRGDDPADTLARFRAVVDTRTSPSSHIPAYLGEVVVHAQDIRQPLGLERTPSIEALTPVAEFFARRNFTVPSSSRAADLLLRADDGPFAAGSGALVTGSTLALVMSMAGRSVYVDELEGPGVQLLRTRSGPLIRR